MVILTSRGVLRHVMVLTLSPLPILYALGPEREPRLAPAYAPKNRCGQPICRAAQCSLKRFKMPLGGIPPSLIWSQS